MQKIIKIIISLIFLFIIGVFFISLNKETDYNTESLIGNRISKISLEYLNERLISS